MMKLFFLFLFLFPTLAFSADMRGRLGIGASNQLANEIPAISLKIQQSKTFAIGGILGFKSDQDETLYGAGVKFYRIIFDEPQLNFYMAGLFATENYLDEKDKTKTGYQIDGTLGTEFHLSGLESLGFSFEFGLSVRDADPDGGTSFETLGDQFVKAAVHFYL
ncbi:hypothetical protein ACJVC5_17325 [Peredibacter sp. HCB2-198]|uniref:hypothetical protein n=1 Tax=Peredibacter sp. HCB2-198 TaxID=3383025 RepID=UPI0038B59AAA